jgi:hypothetical protein
VVWWGGRIGIAPVSRTGGLYGLVGSNPTPTASDADLADFTHLPDGRQGLTQKEGWGWVKNPRQTNKQKAQNLDESEKIIVFGTECGVYRFRIPPPP